MTQLADVVSTAGDLFLSWTEKYGEVVLADVIMSTIVRIPSFLGIEADMSVDGYS